MMLIFYIILGIAPSVIWLLFYLRKDAHPESNRMILNVFFGGVLLMLPAAIIEQGLGDRICGQGWLFAGFVGSCEKIFSPAFLLYNFLAIAFVEEFLKYLVLRWKVLKNSELDEPTDVVLYMIIVALGFAAVENILYLFCNNNLPDTLRHSLARFIGPTFLHTLSSGIFGYFLVLYFCQNKRKIRFFIFGLMAATILHGIFNIFIMKTDEGGGIIYGLILVLTMAAAAIYLSSRFKKVKKMASVCKVK
jgi:RsiW-degrading membrane proteinase PrsW (M82 family)